MSYSYPELKEEEKSLFDLLLLKKKKKIRSKGLKFIRTFNNVKIFEKGKDTFIDGFLSVIKDYPSEDHDEQDLRKSLVEEFQQTLISIKKAVKMKRKMYIHCFQNPQKQTIAFITFYLSKTPSRREIFVDILVVNPDYQRMSLGSLLIYSLFSTFSSVKKIELVTNIDDNHKTLKYYKSLGFVIKHEFLNKYELSLSKRRWSVKAKEYLGIK